MPRQARLDAPGVLHHVMARGIERRRIFRDAQDRDDFLSRVEVLCRTKAWTVYAWALMPNHFHLLVRTGRLPLPRSMRKLLTGYAVSFNRRHRRVGHLFQNRYKSIVVEAEGYFLELVRYLHLNPVRGGEIHTLEELDRHPYSGHSALMGHMERDWQDTGEVLGRYGRRVDEARRRYRDAISQGWSTKRRPDLMGGGLVRSAGGWAAVKDLRRGREKFTSDERVLGSGTFVDQLVREAESAHEERERFRRKAVPLPTLLDRVCQDMGVSSESLMAGSRRAVVTRARAVVAYVWTERLGRSGRELARALAVSPSAVWQAARRAEATSRAWEKRIDRWCK